MKCLNDCMNIKSYEELGPGTSSCQRAASDFVNWYVLNTP